MRLSFTGYRFIDFRRYDSWYFPVWVGDFHASSSLFISCFQAGARLPARARLNLCVGIGPSPLAGHKHMTLWCRPLCLLWFAASCLRIVSLLAKWWLFQLFGLVFVGSFSTISDLSDLLKNNKRKTRIFLPYS
jgi:hypothetical protein